MQRGWLDNNTQVVRTTIKPLIMTDEVKAPNSTEDKTAETEATPEIPKEGQAEPQTEAQPELTVSEALKKADEVKEEKPRLVPEAVLLEYKSQNKELKKDLKELKELIESGATRKEISEDLRDIAAEHDIDPKFLKKLADNIKTETSKELEEKFASRMKPIEDKERAQRLNTIFDEHYNKALDAMPEYKDVASKEIIRLLSLSPANANKTFKQILKDAYGNLVSGRKTMETSKSRGGENLITEIDFRRASRDMEYYDQIMADPVLKAQYNKDLGKRIRL